MKKCVKIREMLFKNWKWLFENTNQTPQKVQKIRSSNLFFIFYSLLKFYFLILYLYLLKFCCASDSPFQPFSSGLRFALKKSFKSVFATLLLTRLLVSTFTLCFYLMGSEICSPQPFSRFTIFWCGWWFMLLSLKKKINIHQLLKKKKKKS